MARKTAQTLNEQAQEILRKAEEKGVNTSFLFKNTFKQYTVQLGLLTQLEKDIKATNTLVEQIYVKGRSNVVINPAIRAYNSTADSTSKTVATLLRIIKDSNGDDGDDSDDPLLALMQGGGDDGADTEQ